MKRFIIKIIVFSTVLYLAMLVFDKIITIGLMNSETKHFDTLSKINQGKLNVDLIINGSSKALVQIDPIIIDSVLEINSYNLGLDGTPFIPQKAQYDLYRIKNKKPKIIVQIVSNGTLRSLKEGFNLPVKFAPYLNIPEVKNLMKLTSSFSYMDYILPMSRYSGKPQDIIIGGLYFFNIPVLKTTDIKGYSPNNSSWPESYRNNKDSLQVNNNLLISKNQQNIETFTSLDSVSIDIFEDFLSLCKKEKITVFLVYPPIHEEDFSTIKNVDYYSKVAQIYDVHFLNYSKDSSLAYNKEYFYNSQHLNLKGATLFTNILSSDIKKRMNAKQ